LTQVVIIGLGYVGLSAAVGFASLGHSVTGIDVDEDKITALVNGQITFHEPDLQIQLIREVAAGKIRFSKSYEVLSEIANPIVFICTPTPQASDGNQDISYVRSAIESVIEHSSSLAELVIKSTVSVGTTAKLHSEYGSTKITLVSNPEFLSEGTAMNDFLNPSRIVVGSSNEDASRRVLDLYSSIHSPKIICSSETAETIKYSSNSLLAVKLSFVNEIAALCEFTGASAAEVFLGMSLDPRIGERFLTPGPGWGGSCFPKDTRELANSARQLGLEMPTLEGAMESNSRRMDQVTSRLEELLGGNVSSKVVAVLGLAFKANTSDIRDSPAMKVAGILLSKGAVVRGYDPVARLPENNKIYQAKTAVEACTGADAVIVMTEWDEFAKIKPRDLRRVMTQNPVVYDTRGILGVRKWESQFHRFMAVGIK
jgi:UDPglucose 6-dehydrogenase